MRLRFLTLSCFVALAMGASLASACSVSVTWFRYVNLVELRGPKIEGLRWRPVQNLLEYTGERPLRVSAIRQGARILLAKWEDGQICAFGGPAGEYCEPNRPALGFRPEGHFQDWQEVGDDLAALKRIHLSLIVEVGGREYPMSLHSRPVRNTRALHRERSHRLIAEVCDRIGAP